MINKILVYADYGTEDLCVLFSIKLLLSQYPNAWIRKIYSEEVIKGTWTEECDLFCMPGGSDREIITKLEGTGVENIKNYVHNGGRYLGICAGAYFACAFIEFNKDVDDPIVLVAPREMKLFPGKAVGPIYRGFREHSSEGLVLAPIKYGNNQTARIIYNGGCGFVPYEDDKTEYNFPAQYEVNGMNAVFAGTAGKGKVLLSGVHFEFDALAASMKLPKEELPKYEMDRMMFIQYIMQFLN